MLTPADRVHRNLSIKSPFLPRLENKLWLNDEPFLKAYLHWFGDSHGAQGLFTRWTSDTSHRAVPMSQLIELWELWTNSVSENKLSNPTSEDVDQDTTVTQGWLHWPGESYPSAFKNKHHRPICYKFWFPKRSCQIMAYLATSKYSLWFYCLPVNTKPL